MRGSSPHSQRLGILGGGQLARMLSQAALRQGFQPVVLAQAADAPAAIDGVDIVTGQLDDVTALRTLFSRVNRVTTENEFLNIPQISAALRDFQGIAIRPALSAIAVAQDKLAQKSLFLELGIATAPFEILQGEDLAREMARLSERFVDGYVLKWSRFGYDGRGNLLVPRPAEVNIEAVKQFRQAGVDKGAVLYAEQLINYESELAMVSTRSEAGEQRFFPLVVSRQEHGICREVLGPAVRLQFPHALERQAQSVLSKIGGQLSMCGTFAVEFFLARDGELLANEMAPRVHNTGHYTLFGQDLNQFDLHIAAVMDAGLPSPTVQRLVAMRNLLGPSGVRERLETVRLPEPPEDVEVYWYEKKDLAPGRKMGHLTGRADTPSQLYQLMQALEDYETVLWRNVVRGKESES